MSSPWRLANMACRTDTPKALLERLATRQASLNPKKWQVNCFNAYIPLPYTNLCENVPIPSSKPNHVNVSMQEAILLE